ncbi:MAG: FUSC family protein [Saprospiraceae bacterium]|nr:FUSC family protein [Saprospiraceae bacterium]
MNQKELSQLTDQELLEVAKNNKPSPIIDAFFIGFLVGIIIYGAAANAWGFVILIPLFLIYLLLKKPKRFEALKKELEKRNLQ